MLRRIFEWVLMVLDKDVFVKYLRLFKKDLPIDVHTTYIRLRETRLRREAIVARAKAIHKEDIWRNHVKQKSWWRLKAKEQKEYRKRARWELMRVV